MKGSRVYGGDRSASLFQQASIAVNFLTPYFQLLVRSQMEELTTPILMGLSSPFQRTCGSLFLLKL